MPKFVSLFSGGGLMDLGFELAGWECVKAVEYDDHAAKTWRHNRPGHEDRMIRGDIRQVTPEMIGAAPGELDAVIGGPPCQGFSVANSSRAHVNGNLAAWKDDPRNLLFKEYLRLVGALQPRLVVMENVKLMFTAGAERTGHPGAIMQEVLGEFRSIGYRVTAVVLDAADFGIPQHRERTFVFGVRSDLGVEPAVPMETYGPGRTPWLTVRDAIGDMPEPGNTLPNHEPSGFVKIVEDGRHTNRILSWDKPSPTIVYGGGSGGARPHPHPNGDRRLTVREGARIQTVPDSYVFQGTMSAAYRQVGNGVPVELARRIAETLTGKAESRPNSSVEQAAFSFDSVMQ